MSNASPPQLPPLPPAAPDSASSASDWFNLSAIARSEQLEAEDDAPETARDSQPNLDFDPSPFVGDYQIVDQLDAGSVTRNYRARKNGRDGLVVLRVIRLGPAVNAEELARQRQTVEKAAALRHPDIVQIYDVGTRPGMIYFAQETLAGGTLAARTARQPQSPDRAADLVETIARAVHAAHVAGIVHGGLKPGNILLDGVGRPRVADFGLSRQFGSPSESPICYLAPEQLDGGTASVAPAADLFEFCTSCSRAARRSSAPRGRRPWRMYAATSQHHRAC